jgi:hypothetical protein
MAGPKPSMQQLAKAIIEKFSLDEDDIDSFAAELLKEKQRRALLEKSGAVASGVYDIQISVCPGCGRPL